MVCTQVYTTWYKVVFKTGYNIVPSIIVNIFTYVWYDDVMITDVHHSKPLV